MLHPNRNGRKRSPSAPAAGAGAPPPATAAARSASDGMLLLPAKAGAQQGELAARRAARAQQAGRLARTASASEREAREALERQRRQHERELADVDAELGRVQWQCRSETERSAATLWSGVRTIVVAGAHRLVQPPPPACRIDLGTV